jgi:hypothetical protein
VIIGIGVTRIWGYAFDGCTGLAGIYFMGTPPAIESNSFNGVPGTVYYIYGTQGWGTSFGGRPTAVWTSVATFEGNGATPSYTTKSYNAGVAYGELPTASRAIHTFEGWWTALDESGTLVETNTLVPLITTGHTLYAKWRINQYTISFDSAGGSAVDSITQDYGTEVTAPDDPTKTGYTFTGWNPTVPTTMPAYNTTCVAQWQIHYEYIISNNQVTITKYIGPGGAVTIPSSIEGYPVTSIGNSAFYQKTGVTSVVIPDGVKSIGDYAFRGCTGLTSVEIPGSVNSIGNDAFYGCAGLTSIVIPDSVTSIGTGTFAYCTGLTSVEIGTGVNSIGNHMFFQCYALTSVVIPDNVTSIGSYAFQGCTALTSVVIPDNVTSIGNYAFAYCADLTSVKIGTGVNSIGSLAFAHCADLTDITVAAGNSSYSSLDGVVFNQNQTELILFPGGKSGAYSIPTSVTSIGDFAFEGCTGLTSMVIPSSVTSIGNYALRGCTALADIYFIGTPPGIRK